MRFVICILWMCFWGNMSYASERFACLIGNAEYKHEYLKSPTNNVLLIESSLKYAGFEVLSINNGTRRSTRSFLKRCYKEAKEADIVLFYYSGHGLHVNGRNRMIPVDVTLNKPKDLEKKTIDLDEILWSFKDVKERIFMLDVNRTQPILGAVKGWRIPTKVPPETSYILGTAPGMTDYGESRRTGVYAEEFGTYLPRPDLDRVSLFRRIHKQVKKRTQNQQLPLLQSNLQDKRYFFNPKQKVTDLEIPVSHIHVRPFTRGCTSKHERVCNDDERPAHQVTLTRDFYMMETEVTQTLYAKVLGLNPSHFLGDNRPVEKVSWRDAILFANRLSMIEGREICYRLEGRDIVWDNPHCSGWRLPTEAEWEFAARAGERYIFSGGDYLDDVAWYAGNSNAQTQPVCEKGKNDFQLCDMSGNVLEWVWDRYGEYEFPMPVNPRGIEEGNLRVLRGGSWYYTAWGFRVSRRFSLKETSRANDAGFRLVHY